MTIAQTNDLSPEHSEASATVPDIPAVLSSSDLNSNVSDTEVQANDLSPEHPEVSASVSDIPAVLSSSDLNSNVSDEATANNPENVLSQNSIFQKRQQSTSVIVTTTEKINPVNEK